MASEARKNPEFTKRVLEAWAALPAEVRVTSTRQLEREATLSNGALKRALDGLLSNPGPDVLAKLAKLLRVSASWLAHGGDGAPAQRTVERDERYPTRRQVLAIMKAKGYAPETLAVVESEAAKSDDDPGAQYWVDRVLFWHRLGASVPAPDAHEDFEAKPLGARAASTRR